MRKLLLTTAAVLALTGSASAHEDYACRITDEGGHVNLWVFGDNIGNTLFEKVYQKDDTVVAFADARPPWTISGNMLIKRDDPSWKIHTAVSASTLTHNGTLVGKGTCDGSSKVMTPDDDILPRWNRLQEACRGERQDEEACNSRNAYTGIVVMSGFCVSYIGDDGDFVWAKGAHLPDGHGTCKSRDAVLSTWKEFASTCRGDPSDEACKKMEEYRPNVIKAGYCWHMGSDETKSYYMKGKADHDGGCN
jgi:hypothetical protein